jgi:hypothetical protein
MRARMLAVLLVPVVLQCRAASADTLTMLLQGVNDSLRPTTPLRADGRVESDSLQGNKQDRLVLVERVGADAKAPAQIYVDLENAKVRVLALGPSELHISTDGKSRPASPEASVDSTNFTTEDWLPFSAVRCAAMRLADINAEQFTLVCEPKKPPSQYSLMVYKFDREKSVMLQVLLYKESMTNLVKMVRNDDFTKVESRWRPKRIVMQDFKIRTKDVISLEWQPAPTVPAGVFDPKTFGTASPPEISAGRKP